jgi:HSP20 family molecular chaperone IbpA
MNRYYSDSDDANYASRQPSDTVRASGWQSPIPTSTPSSSVTRIVVECPFGSKKCDYTVDKSQRGRLIVTARRRQTFSSDYLSSNNVAVQTFQVPHDADVDRLKSHVERDTNRLIIEIPRQQRPNYYRSRQSHINTNDDLNRSPNIERMLGDDTQYIKKSIDNNRKLEYRIDCHGYTSDELEVYIQGRDLIVQGKTNRATSPHSSQQRASKKFTRKIALPNTVDLSKVVSYLDNGELRIEAPLKRSVYYTDEEMITPGPVASNRTAAVFNRIQSPTPGNNQHRYRRHERISRRRVNDRGDNYRPSSPMQRVRSAESRYYPLDRSSRNFDEDDDERENRHRRTVNYERHTINRNNTEQQPIYRSYYSPTSNVVRNRTTYDNYPSDEDTYFRY